MIEGMDPDHADIAIARCGYGRFEHPGALQRQLARLALTRRHDLHRDWAADRPAQPVDNLAMHASMRRDAVNRNDLVLRPDAGAVGRAVRLDGGDAEGIVRPIDRDSNPAPAVACRSLIARQIGRRVSRVSVEAPRHPVQNALLHRLGR
jgi:hypothetical protein